MAQQFWERYLEVFDKVKIVARASRVDRVPEGWHSVNSDRILFHQVPDFCGPWQYLRRYLEVRAAICAAVPTEGAVILRVGSQVANVLESELRRRAYPYALEVVGDPHEVFSRGVVDHPLRRFFRWHFSRRLRNQCLQALGVAYVTKRALQARYPTRAMAASVSDVDLPESAVLTEAAWTTHYSSIELDKGGLAHSGRQARRQGPYQLVTVGSLAQLYKGTDVLIQAVARCVRAGFDLTAVIAGDGKFRSQLMRQAEQHGVGSRIRFLGHVVAGAPVRRLLDESDLFVLPSRTEGMPRALIEAMARALPCIGSAVGGVPELLEEDDLVPPNDPDALARKIQEVLHDPLRMEQMSRRNLATSQEYVDSVLAERRRHFYRHVQEWTRRWETGQKAG